MPVADWGMVLRTIGLSWPGTPAVHDVELSRWIMREEVLEPLLADEELEPAVESLWWVSASQREPGSPAWLKTSGMNRLGLPELEFLGTRFPWYPPAPHLLDELAARIAEDGPPPPGTRMAVGPELELRAVPPREVLPVLPANMPGQAADREPDAAPSIVSSLALRRLVRPDPRGHPRPASCSVWPTNPVWSIGRPEAPSGADLARQTWDDLGMIHAKMARLDTKAMFAIKAVFGPESRENTVGFVSTRLRATPHPVYWMRTLRMVRTSTRRHRVDRDEISDWCVVLNDKRFDPESVPALWRAVDALNPS